MLRPASTVIEICGGISRVAEMVGRHKSNVSRWQMDKSRGGTGGLIPSDAQVALLREARQRGIDLRPEHFFVLSDLADLNAREDAADLTEAPAEEDAA